MKSIDFLRELSIRGALLYNMLGHMASPCIPLIFATSERIANQYDKLKPKALYLAALAAEVTIDREKSLISKGIISCDKSEN